MKWIDRSTHIRRPRMFVVAATGVILVAGCVPERAVAPAAAQDAGAALGRAAQVGMIGDPVARVLALADMLALSPEQVQRLESIQARFVQENRALLDELRASGAPRAPGGMGPMARLTPEEREALRARMEARRHEAGELRRGPRGAAALLSELTPEEREALRARMEARRQEAGELRPGPRGGAGPLSELTPEERGALREQMQARIRGDGTLRRRPVGMGPMARLGREERERLQASLLAVMEEIRTVLTDEQWETLREHGPARAVAPWAGGGVRRFEPGERPARRR